MTEQQPQQSQLPPQTPPPAVLPEMPPAPPPVPPPAAYSPELPPESSRGLPGCAWGMVGALGCLALLLAPIVGLLLMGTVSINSLIGGIQNIFNAPVTISAQTVLESIQGMSQLVTVRYNYSSVITSERDMPDVLRLLYGERQVMVAVGHVNAGVDLSGLTLDDVTQDGDSLLIRLPPPRLLDCFVSEQDSYIASLNTGVFSRSAPDLVVAGRRYAVQQFRDRALEEGILEDVQAHTQAVMQEFINLISPAAQVSISMARPQADAPLPDTCR